MTCPSLSMPGNINDLVPCHSMFATGKLVKSYQQMPYLKSLLKSHQTPRQQYQILPTLSSAQHEAHTYQGEDKLCGPVNKE